MTVYYCTYTMGGTSRGVGIIKALGEGVLVTPYQIIPSREGVPWFGQPPIPQPDDVLIYDKITEYRKRGKRVSIGRGGDVDLMIDWPVLSHSMDDLDLDRARKWWQAPILVNDNLVHSIYEEPPELRVLACRGGPIPKSRSFEDTINDAHPLARTITYGRESFYWPALELMAMADTVIGERQVQNEWAVIRKEADPDGARRAASEIRKLLGNL